MTSETNLFYEQERAENRAVANALERRERTRATSRLHALALEMEYVGETYMGNLSEAQAGRFHAATEAVAKLVAELEGENDVVQG